jgi:hypothetical protein
MKKLILPLAVLMFAAAPVLAGEPAHEGNESCPMHDKTLSDAERTEAMGAMFGKLDADHDGSISRAEFDDHHAQMRAKHEHEEAAAPADAGKHEH